MVIFLREKLRKFGANKFLIGGVIGSGVSGLVNFSMVFNEEMVTPPKYRWSHSGLADSFDHAR